MWPMGLGARRVIEPQGDTDDVDGGSREQVLQVYCAFCSPM